MNQYLSLGGVALGQDGFFHPATELEIQALVRAASARNIQLRVCGAAHSVPESIYADSVPFGFREMANVLLDRYTGCEFDDARRQVFEAVKRHADALTGWVGRVA